MTTPPTNLRQFPARVGIKRGLSTRSGIRLSLQGYEYLIDVFCREKTGDTDEDVLRQLHLGEFMLWLRKRMETTNGRATS